MTGWVVAVVAVALGVGQAMLLRRAVRLGPALAGVAVRLLLVTTLLGLAAASGWLAMGALGWGMGFTGGALMLAWRWE